MFGQAKILQVELSSMCNALCLGCHRTETLNYNRAKYMIPKKQYVSLETFEQLLASKTMEDLWEIEFCGTIDDPLMHPQYLELLELIYNKKPNLSISVHTNASLRTPAYFTDLATILQKFKKHSVHFSIDGLKDTNHIYRQRTNFDKIIENAQAYIAAGGTAIWQFLIFPWNEHQQQEAKELSQELGFEKIVIRRDRSGVSELGLKKVQLKKRNDKREITKPPKNYSASQKLPIECNSLKRSMYYLSYDSRLWPCCFLSNGFFMTPDMQEHLEKRLYDNYGKDFNDLTVNNADEIVAHEFFANDLIKSFDNDVGESKCGKLKRCVDTCTVKELQKRPIGKTLEI